MLALLGWVVAKGLEIAWSLLKRSPERAHEMLGPFAATTIASLADSEDDLMPGTLLLYQHMVPAVPALIIGFCGLEGNELVRSLPFPLGNSLEMIQDPRERPTQGAW